MGTPEASSPGEAKATPSLAPRAAWWRRWLKVPRTHLGKGILAGLAVIVVLAMVFVDALLARPMRAWAERMMNANLKGYTVHIARARPHLWRLAFELDDLILVQNSHPNPPVANFGALKFSMIWSELLHFKVAGDLTIERPALHINLAQIEEEARSHVSLKERGWQRAVESVFPIKLDRVTIREGSVLYLSDRTASKPLQLTHVFMTARNVRNIAAAKGTYPSPVTLEGVLFDSGKLWFKGSADFLREPYAAGQGEIRLQRVPLDRLNPLAQAIQMETKGGFLSVNGAMEYTPEAQTAHLTEVLLENLQVDYVTSKATEAVEKARGKQLLKAAKSVRNAPQLLLQVDTLRLMNSQIGFVNKGGDPPYRLFMSDADLTLKNLSNHSDLGRSTFRGQGAFLGSGHTVVSGGFLSTAKAADFDLHLKMKDARLPDLNRFLLSYAGVDVAEGRFSVFSELTVKNGRIEGYIKPLIKNLKIYDKKKDQGKRFGKRVEMHLLQFLAYVFKNRSTQEVAAVVRISGPTSAPGTDEWEVIRRLLANGFARAVLPGFLSRPGDAAPPPATPPPAGPRSSGPPLVTGKGAS